MVIKLKTLAVILLLSLTAFSQKDISKEQQVCMPLSVAQKVAVDLLRYDSVRVELRSTKEILTITEKKVVKQDSIIVTYEDKVLTAKQEIAAQVEKFNSCSSRVVELEKEVATLTDKNRNLKGWIKGLAGGLVTSLGVLTALIVIK